MESGTGGNLHSMNPYAFERLAMLLLRECGFSQVTVTKKSSDGGIDGTGKLRITAFSASTWRSNANAILVAFPPGISVISVDR